MREAVVEPTVRAPITQAHRGAFKLTPGASRASFAVRAAVQRAGISPTQIEDAILVCGYPQGSTWSQYCPSGRDPGRAYPTRGRRHQRRRSV